MESKIKPKMMKTNVRVSAEMKSGVMLCFEGKPFTDIIKQFVVDFLEDYKNNGKDLIVLDLLKYRTLNRNVVGNSDKIIASKGEMITVKIEEQCYLEAKKICDDIGITFAELIRRLINKNILRRLM